MNIFKELNVAETIFSQEPNGGDQTSVSRLIIHKNIHNTLKS